MKKMSNPFPFFKKPPAPPGPPARYNMKKPTAKNPLFIINTRKIHVAVDILKYPKLFKRLHELAKNDNVTPSQKLACLLNNELKKMEEMGK